ncbi:MAG: PDZ domain-containing protein [Actinomycetota bacterium]|nr:PDZ domain-containing protein [Actinomycetota bacterium]
MESPPRARTDPARLKRWGSLLAVLLVVGLAPFVTIPVLVLEPGPAPDLAGRTEISAPTYPSRGSFHLTTTQIKSVEGSKLARILAAIIDPDKSVLPRESVYPRGYSRKQTEGVQAAQMTQSENSAVVAALRELGLPYEPDGVAVVRVSREADALQKLRAGDVILAADGKPVVRLGDLNGAVAALSVGQPIRLSVRRGEAIEEVLVRTITSRFNRGKAILGISAEQHYRAPVEVKVDNKDIGGPSAGLMLALSIYDLLTPEDLTGGRKIAGTGTIDNRPERIGVVGKVGAMDQKIESARRIGATIFIAPRAEAEDARRAAPPQMKVIGVRSLHEAIAALRELGPPRSSQTK